MLLEIAFCIRLRYREQALVKTDFAIDSLRSRDPMDGTFNLTSGGWAARLTVQIRRASQLNHFADLVLQHVIAANNVSILEPHFASGPKAKIFWRRRFHEIIPFNE